MCAGAQKWGLARREDALQRVSGLPTAAAPPCWGDAPGTLWKRGQVPSRRVLRWVWHPMELGASPHVSLTPTDLKSILNWRANGITPPIRADLIAHTLRTDHRFSRAKAAKTLPDSGQETWSRAGRERGRRRRKAISASTAPWLVGIVVGRHHRWSAPSLVGTVATRRRACSPRDTRA